MLNIGIGFICTGTFLMFWTLGWIPYDRLPSYFKMTVPYKGQFPPGVVLTYRAVVMWISGGFWGIGVGIGATAWNPQKALVMVLCIASLLAAVLVGFFIINIVGNRREKKGNPK